MQRVVVIGTSCSGKTTFARKLAENWAVRHIELDAIHWRPNWTPTQIVEFRNLTMEGVSYESWLLDGNYSAVRDITWARATTIIWLNYPFHVVAWRALNRTFRRVFGRQELWSGNVETFRQAFLTSDSMLWWVLKTYHRRRREYPRLFRAPSNRHLHVLVLTSPAAAEKFLQHSCCQSQPTTEQHE